MTFPQFRKYHHNKTFFKINSCSEFDELQILGSTFTLTNFVAKTFIDKIYITDMLENTNNYWTYSSEEEFKTQLKYCELNCIKR